MRLGAMTLKGEFSCGYDLLVSCLGDYCEGRLSNGRLVKVMHVQIINELRRDAAVRLLKYGGLLLSFT